MDGDLGAGSRVEGVEKLGVVEKHGGLFVFSGDAVVDIRKGKGFGKLLPCLKDAVRPDTTDGDGVLYAVRHGEAFTLRFLRSDKRFDQRRPSFPPVFARFLSLPEENRSS